MDIYWKRINSRVTELKFKAYKSIKTNAFSQDKARYTDCTGHCTGHTSFYDESEHSSQG